MRLFWSKVGIVLMCLAAKVWGQSGSAPVPYFTDFESGVGPEWSAANLETSDQLVFSRFVGRYGNQTQTVALTGLTIGQSYTVGFDLYILDSWDGSTAPGDYFNISVDGFQVFHQT